MLLPVYCMTPTPIPVDCSLPANALEVACTWVPFAGTATDTMTWALPLAVAPLIGIAVVLFVIKFVNGIIFNTY